MTAAADRSIAYKVRSSWMYRLYFPIFSSLYLHDFWPDAGDQAATQLQDDIAGEQQNILAPAEQWIG